PQPLTIPSVVPAHPHPPPLQSFPTRRSSDLFHTAARVTPMRSASPAPETGSPDANARSNSRVLKALFFMMKIFRLNHDRRFFPRDRKSTRLNYSHVSSSHAVCRSTKTTKTT